MIVAAYNGIAYRERTRCPLPFFVAAVFLPFFIPAHKKPPKRKAFRGQLVTAQYYAMDMWVK